MTQLELVAELSHAINNPLSTIRSAVYLASRRTDDPELQKYLELVEQQVLSINSALLHVRSVLDGAAITSGDSV